MRSLSLAGVPLAGFCILIAFTVFRQYGSTCLSSVYFWSSTPLYFVSDADAFRFISNERRLFEKEIDAVSKIRFVTDLQFDEPHCTTKYEPLNAYGKNIVSTAGGEWKRHRAVAKNAFNEVRLDNSTGFSAFSAFSLG